MQSARILLSIAIASTAFAPALLPATASAESWVGRSITLSGRKLHCGKAEIMIDRELPSEGGAGDDFLILNPDMLKQQQPTVCLFVFSHECGHLTVGDSELKADCWAVNRGVRQRWLNRNGLREVCDSFEGAPETPSHPSARQRCRNLNRCFATARAALPANAAQSETVASAPELPIRKRLAQDAPKVLSAWRCTKPPTAGAQAKEPIAHIIGEDAKPSADCR